MTRHNDSGKYISIEHLKRYLRESEANGFGKVVDETDISNIESHDRETITIVRCKDCEYWWKENEVCAEDHHVVDGVCGMDAKADDFCSYGSSRKGGC